MSYRMHIILIVLLCAAFAVAPAFLHSESLRDGPHGDRSLLLGGCGSCHSGHGELNTPMLPVTKDFFCYRCHGASTTVSETRSEGLLSEYTEAADIENVFKKPYRHPVDEIGIHRYGETLPETDPGARRHAECADCHHHHYVTMTNSMAGIRGVNIQGLPVERATYEYELCFKCHANSANLPVNQKNKITQFSTSNMSYHPVVAPGRNSFVPSLVLPLTSTSTIKCSDCHNNDDPSGPRGPHASSHEFLLAKNYVTSDGLENPLQYELCYSCHRRESILANESFYYHDFHLSIVGASCRSCHNPHGMTLNPHLIDFDNADVSISGSGRLEFVDLGNRAGQCYLTCHVNTRTKDHDPASYPVEAPAPDSGASMKFR